MQVSTHANQTLPVRTGESVVPSPIDGRGPCPVCKQYLPQLRLRPFLKHCSNCTVSISQRAVSCSSPGRMTKSLLSKNKHPGLFFLTAETGNLKANVLIDTAEKTYSCPECAKSFSKKNSLAKHQLFHADKKSYKCKNCGKVFVQRCDLTKHQRVHTGEKPYKCNECDKSFTMFSRKASPARPGPVRRGYKRPAGGA